MYDNLIEYCEVYSYVELISIDYNYSNLIFTGTTIPLLKDLYQHITPQYAADWRVIGTLLGLPSGELKAIEAGYPTNVKWCCSQMLEKWLEMDPTASWEKLFTVIDSPAVSSGYIVDKGKSPRV